MKTASTRQLPVNWLCAAILLLAPAALAAQTRKLGTIGPPPRKNPQRQTSAESVPPLPLPATPLRRSEPKAEPSPPLFAGKLSYGSTQDWMPNPGDLDNLLRHVRRNLDAWYGHRPFGADELVALHKEDKPNPLPMLYATGYQAFELTSDQRLALRDYLLDGGTLVADATLGSTAFAESFRREMLNLFPKRPLRRLQIDHPLFRSYYEAPTTAYFTISRGTHSRFAGPPVLEGINLAARTAVIFSPYDMSCGWDEFYAPPAEAKVPDAPRTMAMMPQDAIRIGVNIVSYVAAQRRFARTQAETRGLRGSQQMRRAAFTIGHLRHDGDWNADPNSLNQLLRLAARHTSLPMDYALQPVDADLGQLVRFPFVVMTGMDKPALDDGAVAALRRHVRAGGTLLINNTSGYALFDREARQLVARLLPDEPLAPVGLDHKLFSSLYTLTQVKDAATGRTQDPHVEAVFIGEHAAVIYCPKDALAMLKGIHDPYANCYDESSSRKLALNILAYAVQH
jgi:hypothetical protein